MMVFDEVSGACACPESLHFDVSLEACVEQLNPHEVNATKKQKLKFSSTRSTHSSR